MVRLVLCPLFMRCLVFMAAYNWDVMWLDVVVLAPLIVLGVERACQRGQMLSVLYYTGIVHPVQLLPLDYAVYFSGTLFHRTVNRTQSGGRTHLCPARFPQTGWHQKLLCQGSPPFWRLFPARRRYGGSASSAYTFRTALYGV